MRYEGKLRGGDIGRGGETLTTDGKEGWKEGGEEEVWRDGGRKERLLGDKEGKVGIDRAEGGRGRREVLVGVGWGKW